MQATSIRRLVPSDAARYRALMLEAYEVAPDAFTSSVAERQELQLEWWAGRVSDAASAVELVLGAFAEAELVGAAGLRFEQRERTQHKATVFGMYVKPSFRGHSVGTQLVEQVLRHAAESPSIEVLQLTVSETNRAATDLYLKNGFKIFGTEPFAVKQGNGFITKLHMWRRAKNAP